MIGDRTVITGIGVVSPLGVGRGAVWEGLREGQLGVSRMADLDALPEAYRYAGRVGDFRAEDIIGSMDAST